MDVKLPGLRALPAATLLAAVASAPAQAAKVTLDFTESFGAVPPVGRAPEPFGATVAATGVDAFTADGDGFSDILFDFPHHRETLPKVSTAVKVSCMRPPALPA